MAQTDRVETRGRIPRGFLLRPGWAGKAELENILEWIDEHVDWSKRDASRNPVANYSHHQGNFPAWAERLAVRMMDEGLVHTSPNHVHLTRYALGKGIPPHVDAVNSGRMTFGPDIAAVALRSSRVLEITRRRSRRRLRALLFPGDLYVIAGDLRYEWNHGIPDTDADVFRGVSYPRTEAISATWRALSSRAEARGA